MSNPSNLYAEKVFSEHPLGLWALDDIVDTSLSEATGVNSLKGVKAQAYGLQNAPGYYITDSSNNLFSKNSGIPMVYGASNTTIILPNGSNPSLIVPGFGFLNELGQYKDLSFEMWIRINTSTPQLQRIFGPIYSIDGLYVDGPFLTLKIGSNVGSHFIGEWSRPMLISIVIIKNEASLLINGEKVLSLDYLTSQLSFPKKYNGSVDQDWLGFYCAEDTYPIEIDCVGIYPYKIAEVVAKRRLVYGQGIESLEMVNSLYNATSAVIDYSLSNYANNYNYPDIGSWKQGISDNLSINKDSISIPKYDIPVPIFSTKTSNQWLAEISKSSFQNEDVPFINMVPTSDWANEGGHIPFNKFNCLKEDTAAIYGMFKVKTGQQVVDQEQVLFRIENGFTKDYISANITVNSQGRGSIVYKFKYGNAEEVSLYSDPRTKDFILDQQFLAGLNVDILRSSYSNLATFFGKKNQLKVYLGGPNDLNNPTATSIFTGNIYGLNFCTQRNYNDIIQMFNVNGFIKDENDSIFYMFFDTDIVDNALYPTSQTTSVDNTLDGGPKANTFLKADYDLAIDAIAQHKASYTFGLYKYLGEYRLDIGTNSYWEDHVPLSYFAKYVQTVSGKKIYDLDFIQFNINYPEPTNTFAALLDTSNSYVKTYATFQYLSAGIKSNQKFFSVVKSTPESSVIVPGEDWYTTKYEIVNNSVIYIPKGISVNDVSISIHIEIVTPASNIHPIKIKTLQLASQALNENAPTKIGTKFGTDLYPFKQQDVYYDYKSNNPVTIYKNSTPHLYLTGSSGIQIRGDQTADRGIAMRINENKRSDYQIGAVQVGIRYQDATFPTVPVQIMRIKSSDIDLAVFLKSKANTSNKVGEIYATTAVYNPTKKITEYTQVSAYDIQLFLNGKTNYLLTDNTNIVYIEPKEWNLFTIQFKKKLNFNLYAGSINMHGPLLFNFLSSYRIVNPTTVDTIGLLSWQAIKNEAAEKGNGSWNYWKNKTVGETWQLLISTPITSSPNIDPQTLYNTFIGTNKIIIDDDHRIKLQNYRYQLHNEVVWQTQSINAV